MPKWHQETYKLPKGLQWPARPGYKTFVADQGAVRFDIPHDWIVEPGDNSFKFLDRPSPDDTCTLEMSVFHLRPGPDWSKLSLVELLTNATKDDDVEVLARREPVYQRRGDLEIAWLETRYIDPGERREARSRTCVARRGLIQPLFTFAFWPEDARRVLPAWNELLRSLRLGEYVAFPLQLDRN
ncbi:MAG TPA: hypothetical protein VFE37_19570 [Chloroflexota bacterium]|nr:hypothetical protein [Chloroflexota bacterium]